MTKKTQITIVICTILGVLLLIVLFSLRQFSGTEINMNEKDARSLLDTLGEQVIFDGEHYIYAYTVKDEKDVRASTIVHSTSFSDEVVGEPDNDAIKATVGDAAKLFLDEIVKKGAFEELNATRIFSFSGGDKRIQFDFSEPIPEGFGFDGAYACASLAFDKQDKLQSVTLFFNKGDGKEVCTVIFGDVELYAIISTGGEVVFVPEKE